MAAHRCECCTTRKGRARFGNLPPELGGTAVRAMLCDQCATQGHAVGACKLCMAAGRVVAADVAVWPCGRMAHVARLHPEWLEHQQNAPTPPLIPSRSPYVAGHYDLRSPEHARAQIARDGTPDG